MSDPELLLRTLHTLDMGTLRVLKGVNSGVRSAVRMLLTRPDFQALRFSVRALAERGGAPEAVRRRLRSVIVPRPIAMLDGRPTASGDAAAPKRSSAGQPRTRGAGESRGRWV